MVPPLLQPLPTCHYLQLPQELLQPLRLWLQRHLVQPIPLHRRCPPPLVQSSEQVRHQMSILQIVLSALVLFRGALGVLAGLAQALLFDPEAPYSEVLVSSVLLQQSQARVQVRAPVRAPVRTQMIGKHRLVGPSRVVLLEVHSGVHSVHYGPAVREMVDLSEVGHVSVDLSEIPLPPRLHLPMHPEEPCCRWVSAHLSK